MKPLNVFLTLLAFSLFFSITILAQGNLATQEVKIEDVGAGVDKILLKSRQFIPSVGISAIASEKIKASVLERAHVLIQLDHIPDKTERKNLNKKGVKLLSYIPNKAWFASIPSEEPEKVAALPIVKSIDLILPEDKISPNIREYGVGKWARNDDGTVNLTIMLFDDISLDDATQLISNNYGKVIGRSTLINALIVVVPNESISNLALEDSIQWINEIPPEPQTFNDGSRAAIAVDTVQASPYNLTGTGVVTGEWDGGWVDTTHDDLEGRVTIGDTGASIEDHATHVAGTMLGNGTLSASKGGAPLQWRGMATNATVISYEWWNDVAELDSEYNEAINIYGIDLSTNSWGFTYIGSNKYGRYDDGTAAIDAVVTGNKNKRISIMWAAGNERPDCDDDEYDCIIIPGTAKNTITVGATDSNDDAMTSWSSWGPTDDGRLKPDVVAPGCENDPIRDYTDPSKSIWSTVPTDTYTGMCGTSMSTPAVSGSVALMLQDFRNVHNIFPLPSTLKAILLHTAKDLGNAGPDYSFGYGRINVTTAIDLIRSDNGINNVIIEGVISDQGETDEVNMTVPQGKSELKVTLVWDDYKGTPAADKALVNDLDLVLIAPNGTKYYPWVLDPDSPSNAATTGVDNLNNIEQVYVETPQGGIWTVRINGTVMPNPPQNYSIVSDFSFTIKPEVVVKTFKDSEYSQEDKFFDRGEMVYIQANVTAGGEPITNATVTANLTLSNGTLEESMSLIEIGNGTYRNSWDSSNHNVDVYSIDVNVSDEVTGSGQSYFHLYPGSGISAYKIDWDGDGIDDYVLENEHLISVFNGKEYVDQSVLYLYQKDTDVSHTFGNISDTDSIGRGEITTSNMKDIKFYSFSFSQEGENLTSADLEVKVNVSDPPKTMTLFPASVKIVSDPLLCPDDPLSECKVTNGYFYPDGTTQNDCTDVYMYDDGSEIYSCSFATDQDAASGAFMQCEFNISALPSGSMLNDITYHYNYYSTQSGSQSFDFKYYDCSAVSWATGQSYTISGTGEGDFYSNNYASTFSWWEQCAGMFKFQWIMTSPNWVGPKVITLANDMCSLKVGYTPPFIETSFNLTIQMKSEDVDYLVYKLHNFDQNISDIDNIFAVISGTLGSSVNDDRYHLQDGSDGLITSSTANQWNNYNSNYTIVYDNSTSDAVNDNVIAWVRFGETENITFQDVGLWNDLSYETEGLRIRYNTTQTTSSDEVNYILAFIKGSWQTIDQWISTIEAGNYPDPNFMTPPIGKFISITLLGYPVDFGNLDPEINDSPALGNANDSYIIRIEPETNISVDIYQKGDDYISGDSILEIENMTWSTTNNVATSIPVNETYDQNYPIATNVSSGTDINMYYWIDIPTAHRAGDYTTTLHIKAVEAGTSP